METVPNPMEHIPTNASVLLPGVTAYPFKHYVIGRIIRMGYSPQIPIEPTLVVQGTGGGKSSRY